MLGCFFFLNNTHAEIHFPVSEPSIQMACSPTPIEAPPAPTAGTFDDDPTGVPVVGMFGETLKMKSDGDIIRRTEILGILLACRLERPPKSVHF